MDLLELIDELDDRVHNAKPVPLTDQVRLDKLELFDLLDQMRATFPTEIQQARWIVEQSEREQPASERPRHRCPSPWIRRGTRLTRSCIARASAVSDSWSSFRASLWRRSGHRPDRPL